MSVTKESILKAILLKEFDRMQPEVSTFEDDPMQFILRKYEGLNKTLTYLMTPSFQDYVTGIYIVAPKPTTFKIVLHNGQFFFLQFTGKTYEATVAGKGYYLMNIGEKERCMLAIARLLRYGNPLKTKGPEGAEQGTREGGEEGGGGESAGGEEVPEATPEEGGGEEALSEARILEEVLKKKLTEENDTYSKTLKVSDLNSKTNVKGFDDVGSLIYNLIKTNKGILVSDDTKKVENTREVILQFKDDYGKKFYDKDYSEIKNNDQIFVDVKNPDKNYSISNIVKIKEFGGLTKGAAEKYEIPLAEDLQSQIDQIKKEKDVPSINIVIDGKKYSDIKYAKVQAKPEGQKKPKSDIVLSNSEEEKIFISHKKKGGPTGFIAWSAVSDPEPGSEIYNFKQALQSIAKQKLGLDWKNMFIDKRTKKAYYTKISDDLKLRYIYGKDFGKEFGINNVQLIVQGDLKLEQIENSNDYKLAGYEQMFINPEMPEKQYEPVLVAKFSKDSNSFGFKKCIVYVTTRGNISSGSEYVQTSQFTEDEPIIKNKKKPTIKRAPIPIPSEYAIKARDSKGRTIIYVKNSWIEKELPKYFRGAKDDKIKKEYEKYFIKTGSKDYSELDPNKLYKFKIPDSIFKSTSINK